MKHNYIYYGTKVTTKELTQFIQHVVTVNEHAEKKGRKKTPLCIWGKHGIGKTQIVEDFAKNNGYKFAYIAPAQFEEMGDLVGMPKVIEEKTHFLPPAWVPQEEGPGILLIDDVNRADDRILRGIMQLLQNYELVSWKLPPQWHIILTANPDGGDYSVTPMDAAMITRMLHISVEFNVKAWAKWAEQSGIDERGINFVLTYPESVTGERTTPRTAVQFFDTIAPIQDLEQELPLVKLLADSCFDTNTATTFIAFVNNKLSRLISPEEILEAKDFEKTVHKPLQAIVVKEKSVRVDILATLCTRFSNYLLLKNTITAAQLENIKKFILLKFLPNDLRLALTKEIVISPQKNLKTLVADSEISKLLLEKM